MLKQVHKELKSKKILSETFTHWVPHFLYQNDILHPTITDGKEYSYKQIRRYIKLPFEKVREFWELDNDKGLILPCDQMIGPFISNNRQLFRAGELYKLMKREQQHWNDQISVLNNCRAMRHLIYFYSDMWPFQMITFNKYDRKIWFDANPSEGARRGDLEIRGNDKKSNYLLNKKEIASNTMIEKLEATIDKQQQEIDRKENVLNNTLNLYNDLKMRHAAL
eukprot:813872_1